MPRTLNAPTVAGFGGEIIEAGHPDYDAAREVFNALIDKRPARLLRCRSTADIRAAVRHAVDAGSEIAVRSGGHSVAGHSMSDGGVVVDLTAMRGVHVDAERQIAVVQPGATWRDIDRATGRHQLACPGGVVSTTGVGGFCLGGGFGWLARSHGLTCDNLVGAELVLATGEVLRVSERDHPEVLWALRGGGGNFGVVSEFVLRLHPIDRVLGGIAAYPAAEADRVLGHYASVMDRADDGLACILDFASPEDARAETLVSMLACHTEPGPAGERAMSELLCVPGLRATTRVQRVFRYAAWQQIIDHTAPFGRLNYWKSVFLTELTEPAAAHLSQLGRQRPSAHSRLHLIRMGGAPSRVPAGATAFAARSHPYIVHLITTWEDQADSERCKAWTNAAYETLRPHGPAGGYLNFIGDEGQDRIRASFGETTYKRLAVLKARLDPENQFALNPNIRPATPEQAA